MSHIKPLSFTLLNNDNLNGKAVKQKLYFFITLVLSSVGALQSSWAPALWALLT